MRSSVCTAIILFSLLLLISGQLLAAPSKKELNQIYFEGAKLFEKGKYTEARVKWAGLLNRHRNTLSAKQKKVLESRIGQVDQLVKATAYKLPGQSYTDLALTALNYGARLKMQDPKDARARYEFDKAIVYLEHAVGAEEEDVRYPYIMAYCLLYTSRYETALDFAREAIKATPDSEKAYNLAAEIARKLKKRNKYIYFLQHSLKKNDGQLEVHYRLAKTLISRDKPGDLQLAYSHAVKSVGQDNVKRAKEFAELFPLRRYKDMMDELASDIAIKSKLGRRGSVWNRR
mgnify:CR=1 FL=1